MVYIEQRENICIASMRLIAISILVTPLNLAVNPPFVNILPDCPSDLLASWRNRAGLCYDPGS